MVAYLRDAKAKGTYGEHQTMEWLENRGCVAVRVAGSFGPFDVIAFSKNNTFIISVKKWKRGGWPNPKERQTLCEFGPVARNVVRAIFVWASWARNPQIMILSGGIEVGHANEVKVSVEKFLRCYNLKAQAET